MSEPQKFLNQSQPQTLVIGTLLLYLNAAFSIFNVDWLGVGWALALAVGMGSGAFGIANEKRWGYYVAVITSVLQVLLLFSVFGTQVFDGLLIISLMFDVALVALLLHPESRDYQRIWFK